MDKGVINELALFAGGGGGILGAHLLGWRTRCAVEIVASARRILLARQRDGYLEKFPIWDDVTTFDGNQWRGKIDVVTGGFPCQDISSQGQRAGIDGERSGLVFEMLRIIDEVRPKVVIAENSPVLSSRGLSSILPCLASIGYVGAYGVFGAWEQGAPHNRDRMFIIAADVSQDFAELFRLSKCLESSNTTKDNTKEIQRMDAPKSGRLGRFGKLLLSGGPNRKRPWWPLDEFGRMDDGLADRMDRLAAIGNGQVPAVVKLVWQVLSPIVLDVWRAHQ